MGDRILQVTHAPMNNFRGSTRRGATKISSIDQDSAQAAELGVESTSSTARSSSDYAYIKLGVLNLSQSFLSTFHASWSFLISSIRIQLSVRIRRRHHPLPATRRSTKYCTSGGKTSYAVPGTNYPIRKLFSAPSGQQLRQIGLIGVITDFAVDHT